MKTPALLIILVVLGLCASLPASADQISSGQYRTCAVKDGGVLCWGPDTAGWAAWLPGLGPGSGATEVSVGDATEEVCVVANGGLWCESEWKSIAETFPAGSGVTDVALGHEHACAVVSDEVYCWGQGTYGAVGDGDVLEHFVEIPHGVALGSVSEVSAGFGFTCAIRLGVPYCWGRAGFGQLGDGLNADRGTAGKVVSLPSGAATIEAGPLSTCAVLATGNVWCWGAGPIGNGANSSLVPVQVIYEPTNTPLGSVTSASVGFGHACAGNLSNGAVRCWGDGFHGKLGNGGTENHPKAVSMPQGLGPIAAVVVGLDHSCALITSGVPYCWGDNRFSQLGVWAPETFPAAQRGW